MYSRILFVITISIAVMLLVGCESPEEVRERESAEMELAYESCISGGGAKRPCLIQAYGCTAVTGDINC